MREGVSGCKEVNFSLLPREHLAPSPALLADKLSLPNERRRMKFAWRIEFRYGKQLLTIWTGSSTHFFGATQGSTFFPLPVKTSARP